MTDRRRIHPDDEELVAAAMARELEALTMTTTVGPSEAFTDRVMAAIADEPLPQPVRAFGLALVAGRLRTAAAAVRDAGRIITVPRVPFAVRAQALALVLVVAVGSLAVAGGAAVGAMRLLQQAPPPTLTVPVVSPSPRQSPAPTPSIAPSVTPSPTPTSTADPSETPEPTETAEPTATGTDDHGGGGGGGGDDGTGSDSGSGSGSDGSGSGTSGSGGSGSGSGSEPRSTDDHGGRSDG